MAAAKKKTNTKKKKTTGSGRATTKKNNGRNNSTTHRKRKKSATVSCKTYSRQIGAGICLVLALCVCVSCFNTKAYILRGLSYILRGTIGCGIWLCGPMLAVAGINLLRHRDRPVILRTVCALLIPMLGGMLGQLLLSTEKIELGGNLVMKLWYISQIEPWCGGAISGSLTVLMLVGVGEFISVILVLAVMVLAVIGTFHISPEKVANRVREKHEMYQSNREERRMLRAEEEKQMEEEEAKREMVRSRTRPRPNIDIPLDDEPSAPAVQPENPPVERHKSFFRRKSDKVLTPDQVLKKDKIIKQENVTEPIIQAETAEQENVIDTDAASAAVQPQVKEKMTAAQKRAAAKEVQEAADEVSRAIEDELAEGEEAYHYPPLELLNEGSSANNEAVGEEMRDNAQRLTSTLQSFGVSAKPGEVVHGPSVTRYEFCLDQGVKLSRLTNLSADIALALGASGVRIAPVPRKSSVVGIEIPNRTVTMVHIREVIESRNFKNHTSPVAFALGKDIGGNCIVSNLAKLPHVMIAGTTGSGKSVCTNSLIVSLLYRSTPEEVRFIMVDPKMVELAPYNGIPHLLIPVVTDPKKAAGALQWAVYEMMKRYKTFSETGVKDLNSYNHLMQKDPESKKMPRVVVVIDELADLMLVAAKEVEESICRVAQMGRAAGVHLVIATQRPSADVITGLIKANMPSRIAFAVSSGMESRIILDNTGAESLIGNGDMLYAPVGAGKPIRVQGCFISDDEIERVVNFVKETGEADYSDEVMEKIEEVMKKNDKSAEKVTENAVNGDCDELFPAAVEVILETGQASVSMLQRRLKLGYSRAARLVDQMEERGIVGPFEGSKPRKLLIDRAKWQEMQMANAKPEPTFDRNGSISDVFESHDALE